MKKEEFSELTLAERGMIVMNSGKHLTQIKQNLYLLNLYSINDFFVEVFYSMVDNKIEKIDVVEDLSRIDHYIDNKANKNKLH